jgi:adenylate cyclase
MSRIYFLPDEREIEVSAGESILHASLRGGVPHAHACGGHARCSTCRVQVTHGLDRCAARTDRERVLAERLSFGPELRLACQTTVTGDVRLRRLVFDPEDVRLVERLAAGPPLPVGDERWVAVLFADIRGFTAFSEVVPAYDVIYFLNRYFDAMGRVVTEHGGCVDNLMGDGLMALFRDDPQAAPLQAVKAGLGMLAAVERLRPYFRALYERNLRVGIGVHYGEVVLGGIGTVGSWQGARVTAIGDAVNFASRIEAATRPADADFLISEETYTRVREQVAVGRTFHVPVKGKSGEHTLYEVVGLTKPA